MERPTLAKMSLPQYEIPPDTSQLEEKAAELALLSEFYLRNPDEILLKAIRAVDPSAFNGKKKRESVEKICAFAAKDNAISDDEKVLDLKREWTKLFRGVSPTYGPPPPYAAQFLREVPTKVMTEIVQLYMDGGYNGHEKIQNRVDYLGVLLQYLSFINLLRINAAKKKDKLEYSRLSLCYDECTNHYLKPWVKDFCDKAEKYAKTPFYQGVLDLSKRAVSLDFLFIRKLILMIVFNKKKSNKKVFSVN